MQYFHKISSVDCFSPKILAFKMCIGLKPTFKWQKLKFFKWPVEARSKSESLVIDPYVKMPNFTPEINMFTHWYKKTL